MMMQKRRAYVEISKNNGIEWRTVPSKERRGESAKVNEEKKVFVDTEEFVQLLCICIARLEYEVTAFFAVLLCQHNCIVRTVAVAVAAAVDKYIHTTAHTEKGAVFFGIASLYKYMLRFICNLIQ